MAMNYVDSFIKCDASTIEESTETSGDESSIPSEAQINLSAFWPTVWDEIKKIKNVDAKNQVLPLARIKKIMKLDEDVKMISAEAPLLFAKASEIFIQELTLRAWVHTEDNKRRTLQKNDISMAITKFDQFDFLVDIVPREEIKPVKKENEVKNCEPDHHENYYFQIAQNTLQGSTTPNLQQQQQQQPQQKQQQQQQQQPNQTIQLQTHQIQQQQAPTVSLSQQSQNLVIANPATNQTQMIINQIQQQQEQPAVQLMQQVVLANGEISHVPIPLTQSQLNIIRMQLQNGSNQPLIIQQTGGHVQLSPVNMFLNTATQNTTTDE